MEPENNKQVQPVLEGRNALDLFLKGPDVWNSWSAQSPDTTVNFTSSNIDQYPIYTSGFAGFHFPANGKVIFDDVVFPRNGIDFSKAKFGKGGVSFQRARFRGNKVSFIKTNFGDTGVDFTDAEFDCQLVDFSLALFGEGHNKFDFVNFLKSNVEFDSAYFGSGVVSFVRTKFDSGTVSFARAKFTDGLVDFEHAIFRNGHLFFNRASFGQAKANFSYSSFNHVNFKEASFATASFLYTDFGGHADFSELQTSENTGIIDFRWSSFSKSCNFSTCTPLNRIPDFTGTKNTNHFVLSGLQYILQTKSNGLFATSVHPSDSERLCRLKELAENNKDHRKALQFHADEMRAKRWHQFGFFASLLDYVFDKTSNYGQSITRPLFGLVTTILLMSLYTVGYVFPFSVSISDYLDWYDNMTSISFPTWINGLILSLSHTIPFIGGIQGHGKNALESLISILPAHFGVMSLLFSIPSFSFIFLIGLGLRNRFRL